MDIYDQISNNSRKKFAVLVDPDKYDQQSILSIARSADEARVDFLFVGGSLLTADNMEKCIIQLKKCTSIPVILFPGSQYQVSGRADAILLLSLISGRNPDLLIGKHVVAAPYLQQSGLEIIPTGYLLIDGGKTTTAVYMSNTLPIPRDKADIASCTALAGEMLGLRLMYLDAGSGAESMVPPGMVRSVKEKISVPLVVGGGIRSAAEATESCRAGADLVVVGNAIENDHQQIKSIADAIHSI